LHQRDRLLPVALTREGLRGDAGTRAQRQGFAAEHGARGHVLSRRDGRYPTIASIYRATLPLHPEPCGRLSGNRRVFGP